MGIYKIFGNHVVLCYHRVIPHEIAIKYMVHRALYVTPKTFERHLKWMSANGDIVNHLQLFIPSKRPKFMITFDDGWKDNFEYAFPLLLRFNAPATIFLPTFNVSNNVLFWTEAIDCGIHLSKKSRSDILSFFQDTNGNIENEINHFDSRSINAHWSKNIPHLQKDRFVEMLKVASPAIRNKYLKIFYRQLDIAEPNADGMLLSWDDIRTMRAKGISFGSHTHTHQILDRIDIDSIEYELKMSKYELEKHTGATTTLLSYPNGCYKKPYILQSLLKNDYKFAFTLDRKFVTENTDRFLIPRFLVYEDIAQNLSLYIYRVILKAYLKNMLFKKKEV